MQAGGGFKPLNDSVVSDECASEMQVYFSRQVNPSYSCPVTGQVALWNVDSRRALNQKGLHFRHPDPHPILCISRLTRRDCTHPQHLHVRRPGVREREGQVSPSTPHNMNLLKFPLTPFSTQILLNPWM